MTAKEFKRRRKKLFPVQRDAARAFGVSPASICTWESGETPVPKYAVIILDLLERNPAAVQAIINGFTDSNEQFLNKLKEMAEEYGHSGDWVTVKNFVSFCYRELGKKPPTLTPKMSQDEERS